MGFLVTALGADTGSECRGRTRFRRASAAAALSLACSFWSLAHRCAGIFSFAGAPFSASIAVAHNLPPFGSTHRLPAASAPPPAAGHDVFVRVGEFAAQPGMDDLLEIAGYKWNHLYAVCRDDSLHGSGYRPAHEDADFQFRQPGGLLARCFTCHARSILIDDTPCFGFHQLNPLGDIKNRCDTIVPRCKGCFDHKLHG